MGKFGGLFRLSRSGFGLLVVFAFVMAPGALAWSKEGHIMTCQIAQVTSISFLQVVDLPLMEALAEEH